MIPDLSAPDFWAAGAGLVVFLATALWCSSSNRLSSFMFPALLVQFTVVIFAQTQSYNNTMIYSTAAGQLMGLGCGLIWLSHLFGPAGYRFLRSPLTIAAGCYIVLTLLSSLTSPASTWHSVAAVMVRFAAVALTYLAVVQFVSTRSRWNTMLWMILAITAICWIYGLLQYGGYDPVDRGHERTVLSFFGNKSFYGSWLAYTLPLSLCISWTFPSPWRYLIAGFCATVGVFSMYIADTRSAWLAFGLFLCFAALFGLWSCRHSGRLKDVSFCLKLSMGILIAAVVLWLIAPDRLKSRMITVAQAKTGTNVVRLYMWRGAIDMMLDRPLIGQGAGSFEQVFLAFRDDRFHRKGIQYGSIQAHSEPAEVLAEQGLIGFAAWLSIAVILVYSGIRRLWVEPDRRERLLVFGLLSSVSAGMFNDAMQPTMRLLNHAMTVWILLGLISRYLCGFEPEEDRRRLRVAVPEISAAKRLAWCVVLGVVFAALTAGHARWMSSDKLFREAERNRGTIRYPSLATRALDLNPFNQAAIYGLIGFNTDHRSSPYGEAAARRLNVLSPNQVLGHRNLFSAQIGHFERDKRPDSLNTALLHLAYAARLDNSLDHHIALAYFFIQQNRFQRGLFHIRFVDREISDEHVEEILRHPSRIFLKPGESDDVFDSQEGKGIFGKYPDRFMQGLAEYFSLRGHAEAAMGSNSARELSLCLQAAQRLTGDAQSMRCMLWYSSDDIRRHVYTLGLLERAVIKPIRWTPEQQAVLTGWMEETRKSLVKNPDDPLRSYILGLSMLNLEDPGAEALLQAAASFRSAPWLQSRYQRLMAHKGV